MEFRLRHRYLDLIYSPEDARADAEADQIVRTHSPPPRRQGLLRGGDADAARHRRRRRGPAVRHAPQRPGHRPVPAHRPGAAPEAAAGRRHREGLRDRPGLPQRGHRRPAQSGIHHAGAVPGLRRLPHHDGPDRGPDRRLRRCPGRRAPAARTATRRSTSRRPGSARPTPSCSSKHVGVADETMPRPCAARPSRHGLPTAGKHPDVLVHHLFEEQVEDTAGRAGVRLRLPGRALPADQAQAGQPGASPSASSCTSRAWSWPTPTPS